MARTTKTKKMITLYSSDGEEFKIEESVAKKGRTNSKKHVDSSSSKVITYPKRSNSKKHEDSSSSKVTVYPYRTIVLCSSDGEEFVVGEIDAVLMSETIQHMFEDGCNGKVVPVPDVTGEVLSKVIEYLEKHAYGKTTDEELKAWDAEFVNVDSIMLYELITAANDLGINTLRQLACDRLVASCTKNVNIKNGFTSEKKEEVRRKRRKR